MTIATKVPSQIGSIPQRSPSMKKRKPSPKPPKKC